MSILIADSGSTKCEWCLLQQGKKKIIETQGASPYFLNEPQLVELMQQELLPGLKKDRPSAIFFYGTGCAAAANRALVKRALKKVFPEATIEVENDLTGAARALCGKDKGIVAILGTGSNSGYYDGNGLLGIVPAWASYWEMKAAGPFWAEKCFSTIYTRHLRKTFLPNSINNIIRMLQTFWTAFIKNPCPTVILLLMRCFWQKTGGIL